MTKSHDYKVGDSIKYNDEVCRVTGIDDWYLWLSVTREDKITEHPDSPIPHWMADKPKKEV